MADWFVFVLLVLGTSRLRALVQVDAITERFRELVIYNRWPYSDMRGAILAEWSPDKGKVEFVKRHDLGIENVRPVRFAAWLQCPWCFGTWLAAAAVIVTCQWVSLPLPVLWAAALAYAVGLMARFR